MAKSKSQRLQLFVSKMCEKTRVTNLVLKV